MNKTKSLNIAASLASILLAASLLTSGLLVACSDNKTDIPISSVPANVINIIQNTLPGIALDGAKTMTKKGTTLYKLEGKLINGKEYKIKITESGEIIKIEQED